MLPSQALLLLCATTSIMFNDLVIKIMFMLMYIMIIRII